MAKITDYTTLRTNIESYVKRSGDITSKLDSFIHLAEDDIWDVLRVREMEARATASTSTTSRFLALPDGFIKMRRMKININGEEYGLDEVGLNDLGILSAASVPCKFAISEEIEFERVSDQAYTVELQYYKELDSITSTNTTNAVLTAYPNIYLSACLVHAFQWMKQEQKAEYWLSKFNIATARANRKARQGRYGRLSVKPKRGMIV